MDRIAADALAAAPELSLDFARVKAQLAKGYEKPFLILDTQIVREKCRRFFAAMPRVRPHFAVKSNPDQRVLQVLKEEARFYYSWDFRRFCEIAEKIPHKI